MYRYNTEDHYDEEIDFILRYLFQYAEPKSKQALYPKVNDLMQSLDLAAGYLLFSLVGEHLPHRARCFFAAEDYAGKKAMICEVIEHINQN